MKFDPKEHHRRSIRLQGYDYTQRGAYYITIVTHRRAHLFGEIINTEMKLSRFGLVAKEQWERLPRRFKHLDLIEFVIMPNHVHGVIAITGEPPGTAEGAHNADHSSFRRAPTGEFW